MNLLNIQRLGQLKELEPKSRAQASQIEKGQFQSILESSLEKSQVPEIKFSSHAISRLHARNISVQNEDVARLSKAVQKAEEKGSRDSLIILNNLAFIVSVKNKTVVTAMTQDQMQENVITNIDSTVLA